MCCWALFPGARTFSIAQAFTNGRTVQSKLTWNSYVTLLMISSEGLQALSDVRACRARVLGGYQDDRLAMHAQMLPNFSNHRGITECPHLVELWQKRHNWQGTEETKAGVSICIAVSETDAASADRGQWIIRHMKSHANKDSCPEEGPGQSKQ